MAISTSTANLSPSAIADPETFCTVSTCPLSLAYVDYLPNLAGNILYLSLFGLFLITQMFFGIRHRTWGFLAGMFGGNALEVVGYVGRLRMRDDPFSQGPFLIYLVTLTIAPAFLSASIYLTLARIIPVYSSSLSRFKPRTYTILFITFDIIALLLQAVGGAIASTSDNEDESGSTQVGIDIMVAGVSWQVFSIGLFAILCSEFMWRVTRAREEDLSDRADFVNLRRAPRFRLFLGAMALATSAIFVRSIFRCVELREGFGGKLANDEVTFMVLEGAMVVIAVGLLTIWHPGWVFKSSWQGASWSLRSQKEKNGGLMSEEDEAERHRLGPERHRTFKSLIGKRGG